MCYSTGVWFARKISRTGKTWDGKHSWTKHKCSVQSTIIIYEMLWLLKHVQTKEIVIPSSILIHYISFILAYIEKEIKIFENK